jgi:hypothetical protein
MENMCRKIWWVRSNIGKECDKNVIFSGWGGGGLKVSDQNTDLCGSLIHLYVINIYGTSCLQRKLGVPSYNAVFMSGCDKITLNLICNIYVKKL